MRALPGIERYVDRAEVDALARRIARFEGVSPDQVVIGEVLAPLGLCSRASGPGGRTIVYSTPGYTELVDAAAPLGGRGVGVPLDAPAGERPSGAGRGIDAQTLAVSLVNPHNLIRHGERRSRVRRVRSRGREANAGGRRRGLSRI
ncbi:MAG: hypothetical protein WDN44_03410 [Sphingomonas sp.]